MQGLEVGECVAIREGEGAPSHEGHGGGVQCSGGFSSRLLRLPQAGSQSAAEAEQEGLVFVVKDQ